MERHRSLRKLTSHGQPKRWIFSAHGNRAAAIARGQTLFGVFARSGPQRGSLRVANWGRRSARPAQARRDLLCDPRRARMRIGSENQEVRAGSIVFVAAGVEHRFCEIKEELAVLVFFAPAESA